jgi:hypothetical protein
MVILAALPGMMSELLVTGKIVHPGNFEEFVNSVGAQLRNVGLVGAECVVEVSVTNAPGDRGWEARVFPWEVFLTSTLKPLRRGRKLLVVRHLNKSLLLGK